MTDKLIRRFQIKGTIVDDSKFIQTRETYYKEILAMMKDKGYIPLLDLDPVWDTSYNPDKQNYSCVYTWQGEYVGESAWDFAGKIGQKLIPIPPSK